MKNRKLMKSASTMAAPRPKGLLKKAKSVIAKPMSPAAPRPLGMMQKPVSTRATRFARTYKQPKAW